MSSTKSNITKFQKAVWDYYAEHARSELPWRKTRDPYCILVSEIMLQQTQVERVRPFYTEFIKRFPTTEKLAAAPLSEVLKVWQGLGYNTRAKRLQDAAKAIVERYDGTLPQDAAMLEALPGIGSYTAHAVVAFAYNHDAVLIETNIRTAVSHHFFHDAEKIDDKEVLIILKKALPEGKAREWYSALMDYGSHLKKSGIHINAKSKTYTKQSTFEGSRRQARGAILRALSTGPKTSEFLTNLLGIERHEQMTVMLVFLMKEGLIELKNKKFRLPG